MLVPLRVFSAHSLLESSITYEEATQYCKKENIPYIGISNNNSMFGLFKWTQQLTKNKIKTITGSAIKVNEGYIWCYSLNEEGYIELSNLLTKSYLHEEGKLNIQDIKLKNCYILCDLSISEEEISFLSRNNEIGIAISRQERDAKDEQELLNIAKKLDLPIIAAPKCYFKEKEKILETDCLWCIKNNTFVQNEDRERVYEDEYLKSQEEYKKDFQDIPWAIENTEILAKKCNFQIKEHAPKMPKIKCENPKQLFLEKAQKGFEKRFQENMMLNIEEKYHEELKEEYKKRLEYEIEVINKMEFAEYFLIVSEIVQWSKKNGIMVGPGRGSGAGSLVAYSLEITSINPMQFDLMFERFLNPDRVSLPDFDIDFCQQNRYKVINFIKERFGEENVAHIITFGSLQYRAALRDIGRVLQLPYGMIDDLCKKLPAPFQGVAPTLKELRKNGVLKELINNENEQLFQLAENVEGLPRHSSMHAAGIIITDKQISNTCPLYKDPNVEMPITQFDMKETESVGLVKFDILGLAMLSTLTQTLEFLKRKNIEIDLENLKLKDQHIFKMLEEGKTNSIFQLDSPGMRQVLKEIKPTRFEDIIATTSLYRPGPMAEIPKFIASKNGTNSIAYEYQELEPILKETYGVTVYQEQVLAIAKQLAGYSLKEADILRRAMGKKNPVEMEKNKKQFVSGVLKICKGTEEKAEQFFENLSSFASYGFNKAHATCYSMITYQTAYLKYYHTIEFLCSAMIYEINLEKLSEIIQEAINFKIKVNKPDINKSNINFDIIEDSIYFGLTKVKGVGETAITIIKEREKNGAFKSVKDFIKRTTPNKRAIENLILAGAFDDLNKEETIKTQRAKQLNESQEKINNTMSLFDDFEEEIHPLTNIEIAKEEFDKLGYIFSQEMFDINSEKLGITNSIHNIKHTGIVYAFGIKPIIKNTKDNKKIFAYEFFEKNGLQKLFANEQYENKSEFLFLEIEKLPNRFIIKKITEEKKYLKKFKKIFIKTNNTKELKKGETSIYLETGSTPKFIDNFEITTEFLINNSNIITFIQ
ncbi:DNA polymerase III subunit alpha [Alphaproteobacteria bacterium endosymbiont of Tiliacea citrago]|uniref:DNA polymerase III subunit alpha n=1 Tax=Alphaproteobacteria bacterium endosymbiont of Tiliacea citrago TaxID=3077944 RepID=UPI00313D069D